jgi:protein dithiol oxidoreductase (disulfide-forming)
MKRRDFSGRAATLAASGVVAPALWVPAGAASAQAAPASWVEGQHFVRLAQPLAQAAGGKIEVAEFFWYGCPHCNAFEPLLDSWAKRQPADVAVRRVPVAFRPEPFEAHQRIYFALEALGKVDQMHRRVFSAIHNERQRLDKPNDIAAFMGKNGIDSAQFLEAYNSFSVQTKVGQAKRLAESYKIDGVPAMGVGGRFFTSSSLAGTPDRTLAVTDFLIARVRRGT